MKKKKKGGEKEGSNDGVGAKSESAFLAQVSGPGRRPPPSPPFRKYIIGVEPFRGALYEAQPEGAQNRSYRRAHALFKDVRRALVLSL